MSLKELNRMAEEAKEREETLKNKVKSMEQQIQTLNERDQEVSYSFPPDNKLTTEP